MREKLFGLILVFVGMGVPAMALSEDGAKPYNCPACGSQFEAPPPSKASFEDEFSEAKSMDSDFCYYGEEGSPLLRMITTCPSCMFSAYAKEFSQPLRESHKAEVKSMLERNPAPESVRGGVIPPWMRWQYAARCYRITRRDLAFVGQAFHGGAYSARIEATAMATSRLPLKGPESVLPQLEEVEKQISAENDRQKKAELALVAAQAAQRGGFVEVRDKWLAQLRKDPSLDEHLRQEIEKFTGLVAAEETCLREALDCFTAAMEAEQVPYRNRSLYNYLMADTMRRLGERRSPVVRYYARVIEDEGARADLKRLARYFIDYLNAI